MVGSIAKNISKRLANRGITFSDALAVGGSVWAGTSAYSSARQEGSGKGTALAKGVAEAVMADIVGLPLYLGFGLMTGVPKAIVGGMESLSTYARGMEQGRPNQPFRNNTFVDTQTTYTMRQAGMQLAQRSKYNLQHAMLGEEARFLHR